MMEPFLGLNDNGDALQIVMVHVHQMFNADDTMSDLYVYKDVAVDHQQIFQLPALECPQLLHAWTISADKDISVQQVIIAAVVNLVQNLVHA